MLFDGCLTKSMHFIILRVGKWRLFDRGVTKSMHCIVHYESRRDEAFLQVSD